MKVDDLVSMFLLLGVIPVSILVILFFIQKAKYQERMKLIEKGIDISNVNGKPGIFQSPLMWGMLATGVGFGLLIGSILFETKVFHDDAILGTFSLLFGGIGLIGYHLIKRRDAKNDVK